MILLNCPYCKATLPKIPERKTKCKKCGGYYYKRAYPPDVNGEEFIVTEEEAKRIDKMWFEYNTKDTTFNISNPIQNPTTELEESLYKIEQLLKIADIYGGKINLDEQIITSEELKELREDLKFKITAEISQRTLKIVK